MFSIEAIDAVIAAARAYAEWARETGDYPHDEAGCRAHEAILAAVRALDGVDSPEPMTFVGGYVRLQEVTRAAARDPNSNREWALREALAERIANLAGVDAEGGILPPDTTGGIDRTPSPWWKS
jgi:hypothetical protein